MTTWPRCTLTTWDKSATCREKGEGGGGGAPVPVRPSLLGRLHTCHTLTNTYVIPPPSHRTHSHTRAKHTRTHSHHASVVRPPCAARSTAASGLSNASRVAACIVRPEGVLSHASSPSRPLGAHPAEPCQCSARAALRTPGGVAKSTERDVAAGCAAVRMNPALGNAQNGMTILTPAYAPPLVAPPAAAPQLGCGLLRQMRTVASSLPDANVSPSGAWRTTHTGPWWPRRLSNSAPVS